MNKKDDTYYRVKKLTLELKDVRWRASYVELYSTVFDNLGTFGTTTEGIAEITELKVKDESEG
jgi:hypothetical protein